MLVPHGKKKAIAAATKERRGLDEPKNRFWEKRSPKVNCGQSPSQCIMKMGYLRTYITVRYMLKRLVFSWLSLVRSSTHEQEETDLGV